jgi:hypothetical protein
MVPPGGKQIPRTRTTGGQLLGSNTASMTRRPRWAELGDGGEDLLARGGVVGYVAGLEGIKDGGADLFAHHSQGFQSPHNLEDRLGCVSRWLAS